MSNDRRTFLASEDAKIMKVELESLFMDPAFGQALINMNKEDYVEKHLNYVSRYPYIDSRQYINNLKIKSRI